MPKNTQTKPKPTVSSKPRTKEEKASKFTELFEKRMNKVLNQIYNIGKLSNTNNYVYTEEQYSKGIESLREMVNSVEERFKTANRKTNSISFKL